MKNNKNKLTVKLFSFLLSIIFILLCFPVYALSTDGIEENENSADLPENTQLPDTTDDEEFFGEEEEFIPWELELKEGDLTLIELKTAELSASETPEIISTTLINKNHHVNRLYEQEPDVFTIMFQNRDGSKTIYVFSHPVKTVSADGVYTDMTVSEIQTVVNSKYAETNAANGTPASLSLTVVEEDLRIDLGSEFIKSRIGNPDSESPIMSYNIGELVIFKAGSSTLCGGITTAAYDVTEEAREWATAGAVTSEFTFTPEANDDMHMDMNANATLGGSVGIITPIDEEELVVMSITVSEIAGIYAVQSTANNRYLSYSTSDQLTFYSVISIPRGKWHFQFLGNGNYIITPMSRQDLRLSYYDGEICFLRHDDPDVSIWNLRQDGNNTFSFFVENYYLSDTLDMVLDVDGNTKTWQLSNPDDAELLTSITINNILIHPGDVIPTPVITKYPELTAITSNDEYFEWFSPDSDNIYYNVDEGFCINETYGVYRFYCRYKFNPDVISNVAVIIITDEYNITSGAVYLIREYDTNIDENTKLLTMTVGEGSNALSVNTWTSSWFSYKNIYNKEWTNTSQGFTITDLGSNLYKISAILSTVQYEVPYSVSSNFPYTGNYTLPDKNTKPNTISAHSNGSIQLSAYSNASSQKWYIYCIGNQFYFVNSYNFDCRLGYDDNGNIASDNLNWSVTYFGIDVPCIRQVTGYYCGPTAALQVLYGCNIPEIINSDETISELQSQFAEICKATYDYGTPFINITNKLLNIQNRFIDNPYSTKWKPYNDSMVTTSIEKGYPVIVHVIIGSLPYYKSSDENNRAGHYICVFGYDEATGLVAVSDCTCYNQFGIRFVTLSDLRNACNNGLIYHT